MFYIFHKGGGFKAKLDFLPANLGEMDILVESDVDYEGPIFFEDGKIKESKRVELSNAVNVDAHIEELLEAVAGMNDLLIAQQMEIELLKGEKQ